MSRLHRGSSPSPPSQRPMIKAFDNIQSTPLYGHRLSAHCENLTETANDLSKVLSIIQSTWLSRKLKASVQSKVTNFFK